MRSPAGVLGIDDVAAIDPSEVTDQDARAAGFADAGQVLGELARDGTLYRIRFHHLGDDPRVELRRREDLDGEDARSLAAALARLPWAFDTLRLIEASPGVVSTELAATAGVDRPTFKRRVRRLKELGLTESLPVGYRISPRGRAALIQDGRSPVQSRVLDWPDGRPGKEPPRRA